MDERLERDLRVGLAALLDPIAEDHPRWATSPAAERVLRAPERHRRGFGPTPAMAWALLLVGMVLVLVVAVLVAGSRRPDHAVVIAPSPTATYPITSASPSSTSAPTPSMMAGNVVAGLTWQRVALSPGISYRSVTHDSDGFLAVGASSDSPPSLWRSDDGIAWREMTLSPASAFATDSSHQLAISRVMRQGATLVAVGSRSIVTGPSRESTGADAAAWVSGDAGATWRQAPGTGFSDAVMEDVAFGPGGWVAVGSNGYLTRGSAVWTSSDGQRWTRVAEQPSFATGRMAQIEAVAPGYVATGNGIYTGPSRAPVWTSADGVRWSQPTLEGEGVTWVVPSARLVEQGGAEFIFTRPFGGTTPEDLATTVWRSSDGLHWTMAGRVPARSNGFPVALADGLLMVSYRSEAGSNGTVSWTAMGLWSSTDGTAWEEAPLISPLVGGLAVDGTFAVGRVVLVGEGSSWVGTLAP